MEERSLQVAGSIAPDGTSVSLEWWQTEPQGPAAVSIYRRELGDEAVSSWQLLTEASAGTSTYTDSTTQAGIAYEYGIERAYSYNSTDSINQAGGYWATGIELPLIESRGIVLLIIDESFETSLSLEINRLVSDLQGDGWKVVTHTTPRHDDTLATAQSLRSWIQGQYALAPNTQHALLLLGHVPYVMTGWDNPDGHERVPHPSDLFFADIDGNWTDSVTRNNPGNTAGEGILDQSKIPSTDPSAPYNRIDGTNRIELWVGRIDFANLSADSRSELTMLQDYLNKHHAYRQVSYPHPKTAYWDHMAFDDSSTERYTATNIVGPQQMTQGTHVEYGQANPSLWGIDFGDADGSNYPNYDIKTVFTINFGSHKQKWQQSNNPMRALLAQDWYVLTCGWGVRPNWYLHHMALGHPIGYSHYRTANNGWDPTESRYEYNVVDDYSNQYANAVWINLMGDPTLRAFVPQPPANLEVETAGDSVELSWQASPAENITGYRLYRTNGPDTDFLPLNTGNLVIGTSYTDPNPVTGSTYMVRAERMEQVHAGSFANLSQGVFAQVGNTPPIPVDQSLSVKSELSLNIQLSASDIDNDNLLITRNSVPAHGTVQGTGSTLIYTPDLGFIGTDDFTFSVWDGIAERFGTIQIEVLEPSEPPVITNIDADRFVRSGHNELLSLEYTGDLPMQFQWYRNDTPLSDNNEFKGTQSDMLTLIAPQVDASGYYHVVLSNALNSTDNAANPIVVKVIDEPTEAALVLHYRFDNESGNDILDDSPASNDHSTTVSNLKRGTDGRFGGALGLDTPLDAELTPFTIPNHADLNFDPQADSYTLSAWVRTTNTSGYRSILRKSASNPTNRQFILSCSSPVTKVEFYNGNSRLDLDTAALGNPVNDGTWHLLTAVNFYDATLKKWRTRLYYDSSDFVEMDSGTSGPTDADFYVGTTNPWRGQIDDIRIYRKALNANEVAELYAGTLPDPQTYADWSATIDWDGADSNAGSTHPETGLSNRLLYAMDAPSGLTATSELLPKLDIDRQTPESPSLHFDFRLRTHAHDIITGIETSTDLATWTPLLVDGTVIEEVTIDADPDGDGSAVLKRIKLPLEQIEKSRFLRLAIDDN